MQFSFFNLSEPRVMIFWSVVLLVAFLTWLAARGASWKSAEQQIRERVQSATGIPAKGGFSSQELVRMAFSLALLGGAFAVLHWHASSQRKIGGRDMLLMQALVAGGFLLPLLRKSAIRSGLREIERKYQAGDYQGALQKNDRLLRWFSDNSTLHFFRARTLFFWGRLPDAEQAFRAGLEKGQKRGSVLQAAGLCGLGRVLLEQDNFSTATPLLEASAKINPWFGAYDGLADILVRQKEPSRALRLLDNAIGLNGDPRAKHGRGGSLRAVRAQALAMLGRIDEALSDLEMTVEGTNQNSVPDLAENFWRSALAFRAMDREEQACKQFEQANQIDPNGLYGTRSAAALRESTLRI